MSSVLPHLFDLSLFYLNQSCEFAFKLPTITVLNELFFDLELVKDYLKTF